MSSAFDLPRRWFKAGFGNGRIKQSG